MSVSKILKHYLTGMAAYDHCHPPNIASQWQALRDEALEFMAQPSRAEAWDILHAAGRLIKKITGLPLNLLAWPTVCKHSQRFAEHGCIRSCRNCEGKCCALNSVSD